jgi:YfiR/HmsC-like
MGEGERRRTCKRPRLRRYAETMGRSMRRPAALFAALALLTTISSAGAQNAKSGEYEIKAAFLFHFAQFVDWPAEAFEQADSPITYCTIGADPFEGALDAALKGKTHGSRAFAVRHLASWENVQACQLLFIGAAENKHTTAALASVEKRATLTVGETEHFAADGGMIGFCFEDNKIRFEINVRAAEQANLKISARLLALAKTVIGGPKGT